MSTHHPVSGLFRTLAATAAVLLGLLAPAGAQVTLGMAPMRTELRLLPGQQRTGTIRLTNQSARQIRVRGEVLDFTIDATGTPQFERSIREEAAYSCEPWVSLNPMEVELAPRSQQVVRYTVRVPQQVAQAGYHCAVSYLTLPPAEQASEPGMGLQSAVRMISAIYIVTGDVAPEGGLSEVKVERSQNSEGTVWRGVIVMNNPGAVHYRPVGELALLDTAGKELESQKLVTVPVLPKREQRFLVPLKSPLQPGTYKLRARVDFGAAEVQEGTVVFEVPPAAP